VIFCLIKKKVWQKNDSYKKKMKLVSINYLKLMKYGVKYEPHGNHKMDFGETAWSLIHRSAIRFGRV
jgi:hypothetical protein